MEDPAQIRVRLLLSIQRALLGAVPATLREVACGWEGTEVKLRFVFDGEIDTDDYEGAQIVGSEVIADFSEPWTILEEIFVSTTRPISESADLPGTWSWRINAKSP
jgi:hypothetical protein